MASVEFTIRNKRTGRLSFRRIYPKALRPKIPLAPSELKRSLGGPSFASPGVAERYRAAMQEYDGIVARARGEVGGEVDKASVVPRPWADAAGKGSAASLRRPSKESRRGSTFDAIARTILDNDAMGIGPSTIQSTNTALKAFKRFLGSPTPDAIMRADVAEFRNRLVNGEHAAGESAALSGKTVGGYLGALSAVWNKGQGEGLIPYECPNPFNRHRIPLDVKSDEPTELSRDELGAIFSLPLFTQGERPNGGKGGAAYWLPLMLLLTGARPEELAQLLVDDFNVDPSSGRLMVKFTDVGEHPVKGRRTLKASRTGWGRRTIPVPLPLIEWGLQAYLDGLWSEGERALFPALRPKGRRNLLFAGFSEWWSKYLKAAGAFPKGEGRRGAREFRHNWNTAARRAGVALEAREYIMGHSNSGRSCNASYGSRMSLGWEVDRVAFDGLDLSQVRPWKALTARAVPPSKREILQENRRV